jgi:hypothetical protein
MTPDVPLYCLLVALVLYLLDRNIIQVCLMGVVTEEQYLQMVKSFAEVSENIFYGNLLTCGNTELGTMPCDCF